MEVKKYEILLFIICDLNQHTDFWTRRGMRHARIIQQGAIYHVVAKANRGEFIFQKDEMKEMFLRILEKAKKRYRFRIRHYCVMSNHVHLILEPVGDTNLSELMKWVLSVFARRYNILIGQKGHVWYDRFKSKIIRSFVQFVHTFRYISNNPVKAGLCSEAREYIYGGMYEFKIKRFRLMDSLDSWLDRISLRNA